MNDFEKLVVTIFGGIITIAVISVIVSRNSDTTNAISAFGNALSSVVKAAVTPVQASSSSGASNGSNSFTSVLNTFNNELDTLGPLGIM